MTPARLIWLSAGVIFTIAGVWFAFLQRYPAPALHAVGIALLIPGAVIMVLALGMPRSGV